MNLDETIKQKFKNKTSKQIIAIINTGKKNIDDETYEINRRGEVLRFDGDKAYLSILGNV